MNWLNIDYWLCRWLGHKWNAFRPMHMTPPAMNRPFQEYRLCLRCGVFDHVRISAQVSDGSPK